MNNIFDDFPAPLNGMEGFNQWQRVVQSGAFRLYTGQIINTKDHNPWSNHYDVSLFEYDETGKRIPLYEVKVLAPTLGFDGANSTYHTFYENQPVLILARDGILDQAVIIGGFNTSGDHKKYLQLGHADKPGEIYEDYQGQKEANQGSVYPYRVAKPQGYVRTVAGTNLTSPHDDPRYYYNPGDDPEDNLAKKVAARPQIAGVEIMNEAGYVNHHIGPVSLYSYSQVILLSRNNRENECARLQRHAAFYASMHQKLSTQSKGGVIDTSTTLANAQTNTPSSLHGGLPPTEPWAQSLAVGDMFSGLLNNTPGSTTNTPKAANSTSSSTNKDWLSSMQFGDMFSSLNQQPSNVPTSSWVSELTGRPDLSQLFFDLMPQEARTATTAASTAPSTDPGVEGAGAAGPDYLEALPTSYHLEQLAKLAQMYQQAAASCNSGQAAMRDATACTNPCEGQSTGGSQTVDSTGVTVNAAGQGVVSSGGVFTPEVRAFLDLIAHKEVHDGLGLQGYYENNGVGRSKGHFTKEEAQQGFPASAGRTYNVGRYQFNRGDWEDAKKANPAIRAYTPQDQDLMAYWKMQYRNALAPLQQGDIKTAILKAGKEWASLPGSPYGQVQANYTTEKAIAYYNQRLAYHKSKGGALQSSPTSQPPSTNASSTSTPTNRNQTATAPITNNASGAATQGQSQECTAPTVTASSTGSVTQGLKQGDACYGQSNCYGHKRYLEASTGDLVTVPAKYAIRGGIQVHKNIYQALIALLDKAKSEGVDIKVTSGFISIEAQRPLFNTGVPPQQRAKDVAPPGFSEHHTGYAVDLCDGDNCVLERAHKSRAWDWLKANATKDFILSFPQGGTQGAQYEPWHWRGKGMPAPIGGSALPTPTNSPSCPPPPCNPSCGAPARDMGATASQPLQQQSSGTSSSRANLELDDIIKALNAGKQDNQKVQLIKVTGGGNTWQATSIVANQGTPPSKSTIRAKVNNVDYQIEVTGGSITEVNNKVTEALKKISQQLGAAPNTSTTNPNAPINNPGGSR